MNTLTFTNHFAQRDFISYLIQKSNLHDDVFALLMLEKVTDYGMKHHTTTRDSLAYFLTDTIPELDFAEAAAFCDDEILTDNGQRARHEFWKLGGVLPDSEKALNDYCVLMNCNCDACKYKNVYCNLQNS